MADGWVGDAWTLVGDLAVQGAAVVPQAQSTAAVAVPDCILIPAAYAIYCLVLIARERNQYKESGQRTLDTWNGEQQRWEANHAKWKVDLEVWKASGSPVTVLDRLLRERWEKVGE